MPWNRRGQGQSFSRRGRGRGSIAKITDARQIIKQKTRNRDRGNRNLRNGQTSNNLFSRQFRQVMNQNQKRNFSNRSFNNSFTSNRGRRRGFGNRQFTQSRSPSKRGRFSNVNPLKRVLVGRGGILKVTSDLQNGDSGDEGVVSKDRRIYSALPGITVVANSRYGRNANVRDAMEGDDELERMTLDDLPEVDRISNLPQGLMAKHKMRTTPQPPSTSQSSSLLGRIFGGGNTMVADDIPSSLSEPSSYSVVVTNLQPTVTEDDIIELFGSVAHMKSARLVQPGAAIVEYYTRDHAVKACNRYNSLHLDGQPMHCAIKSDPPPSRTPVTMRLGENYGIISPPRQTASSIFLQSPYTSSPPGRNVEFTVKLP